MVWLGWSYNGSSVTLFGTPQFVGSWISWSAWHVLHKKWGMWNRAIVITSIFFFPPLLLYLFTLLIFWGVFGKFMTALYKKPGPSSSVPNSPWPWRFGFWTDLPCSDTLRNLNSIHARDVYILALCNPTFESIISRRRLPAGSTSWTTPPDKVRWNIVDISKFFIFYFLFCETTQSRLGAWIWHGPDYCCLRRSRYEEPREKKTPPLQRGSSVDSIPCSASQEDADMVLAAKKKIVRGLWMDGRQYRFIEVNSKHYMYVRRSPY